ncbi:hypothetical protein EZV62_005652 [Acer yangbiense]|uniref:DUF4283 domain-containing protein n=1 Tax=Acer yangbiense TaxID=1000413 RepID=A0A5C7IMV5_9ROSI|nr:hypothetical protein EZV62_005652 [Acer yangbiense]
MGSEEIKRLYASMSLKEKEGPVWRLQDGLKAVGAKKMALCLAGKIQAPDLINREAFRSLIAKIWKVQQGVEIEVISNNIYAFHFQSVDDRRKVLLGGPWSFDDALIVLEELAGKGAITSLKRGEVREVDSGPSGDCLGKFLRVRVAIDIDKPLRRFLRVDVLGDGEETVMPIQYERLPNFCFRCGLLCHTIRGCSMIGTEGLLNRKDLGYGTWLKAEVRKFTQQSLQYNSDQSPSAIVAGGGTRNGMIGMCGNLGNSSASGGDSLGDKFDSNLNFDKANLSKGSDKGKDAGLELGGVDQFTFSVGNIGHSPNGPDLVGGPETLGCVSNNICVSSSPVLMSNEGIRPTTGGDICLLRRKSKEPNKGKWKRAARLGPVVGANPYVGDLSGKR